MKIRFSGGFKMSSAKITVGDLKFQVISEGAGEPVILLHGFPDSARVWRNQIPHLAHSGLQVIAPDLRGFGDSDKPTETESYALAKIVGDVLGILDEFNVKRVKVVGHDWGAAVGWTLAALYPERVERLVALSVGHPTTFFKAGLEQREKSWYMLFFQFRGVAEEIIMRDNWKLFRDWVRYHHESGRWIEDLSRPGALTAALNWYRANVAPEMAVAERWALPNVPVPTLGVWSTGDNYLTEAQMLLSSQCVTGSWRYERIEGASHWMQLDRPNLINDLLLQFLTEKS
jgi:pimeloyl-ACP methyl ester carboxylesterase